MSEEFIIIIIIIWYRGCDATINSVTCVNRIRRRIMIVD